jgi:hypothetical protein
MGLDAGRADGEPFRFAIHLSTNLLEIGEPAAARAVVGVADVVSAHGTFAADVTNLCHGLSLNFSTHQYTQKPLCAQPVP